MATYAQLGAKLLRDAATLFRRLADQNEPLKDRLTENAAIYENVADMLHRNPLAEIRDTPPAPPDSKATP